MSDVKQVPEIHSANFSAKSTPHTGFSFDLYSSPTSPKIHELRVRQGVIQHNREAPAPVAGTRPAPINPMTGLSCS